MNKTCNFAVAIVTRFRQEYLSGAPVRSHLHVSMCKKGEDDMAEKKTLLVLRSFKGGVDIKVRASVRELVGSGGLADSSGHLGCRHTSCASHGALIKHS